MITDSREDLTNSVAAAVKEHKGKFRGLDCNKTMKTKTVMKRWGINRLMAWFYSPDIISDLFIYCVLGTMKEQYKALYCYYCRILHNLMNNDGKRIKEKGEQSQAPENLDSVS